MLRRAGCAKNRETMHAIQELERSASSSAEVVVGAPEASGRGGAVWVRAPRASRESVAVGGLERRRYKRDTSGQQFGHDAAQRRGGEGNRGCGKRSQA